MDVNIILFLTSLYGVFPVNSVHPVYNLDETTLIRCCNKPRDDLSIYCYGGNPKQIVRIWETVQLQVSLSPDEYEHFEGLNPKDVSQKFEDLKSSWSFNLYTNKRKFIKLNPFNKTCIGISTQKDYELNLNRKRVDYWRVVLFVTGFTLFLFAPKISGNSFFYYITGISVGTCASLLILIYILSRFMPKKPMMYSFLAGGWTIGVYLANLIFENIKTLAVDYKMYVLYYLIATGILSFAICYRYGPVTDPRSINLIKWAMQAVALVMVFFSSDFQEASLALCLILLLTYNTPFLKIFNYSNKIKKWWKPVKPRLLTEDEYHQQGAIETEKALDELREYCSSPNCNQWRTVLKLNSPLRFAEFMEGSSHLDDSEILAFHHEDIKTMEIESEDDLLTDDSSD